MVGLTLSLLGCLLDPAVYVVERVRGLHGESDLDYLRRRYPHLTVVELWTDGTH